MDTELIEIACEEFHKKFGVYPNHIIINNENEVELYYETEDKVI